MWLRAAGHALGSPLRGVLRGHPSRTTARADPPARARQRRLGRTGPTRRGLRKGDGPGAAVSAGITTLMLIVITAVLFRTIGQTLRELRAASRAAARADRESRRSESGARPRAADRRRAA